MDKEIKLVAYDPMISVKCMDEYFKTKTPYCSLYSEDGYEITVHCEVLYQTKWVVYFDFEKFNFYFIIEFCILATSFNFSKVLSSYGIYSRKCCRTFHFEFSWI